MTGIKSRDRISSLPHLFLAYLVSILGQQSAGLPSEAKISKIT
jgi:hypothetical protein